jgi:DNA transformation protein
MDSEAIGDVFRAVGPIRIRRMFSGRGIYQADLMFALEAGGELYLKVDSETEAFFRNLGSRPFTYAGRNGRMVGLSYWLMPESALDDPDEAADLAKTALQAALRAGRGRSAKRRRSRAAFVSGPTG